MAWCRQVTSHLLCQYWYLTMSPYIVTRPQRVKHWDLNKMACIWQNILQWRHNGHDSVSNHQPHDCLLNRLFRHRSKKIWKFRVTGLCAGNSTETGDFPAQMAANAESTSIWWRNHEILNANFFVQIIVFCLQFCFQGSYYNKLPLVQVKTLRRVGDKPLPA